MAQDGLLFRTFCPFTSGIPHTLPSFDLPMFWAVVLTLTGSYEVLLSYCTFGAWIFYAMVVGGLLVLGAGVRK